MVAEDFLNDLNEAQQEAVKEINGPALIIAGAGSGKTRVLTCRVAWLLRQGIPAPNILALTFTNKAAAEMKERIGKLVGYETAKRLWMGTFHSIFSKILRIESRHLGYSPNYTIYDTEDSKSLIRTVIKELMLDDQIYKPGEVFGRISSARNNLITAGAYAANSALAAEDSRNRKPMIAEIFRIYQKRCHAADAMDFDDLLLNTNILFRDFPDVLKKYQEMFRYILVDEYQDTNYAQYLIISRLAEKHNNISVVGDDSQSIYSFRGARIENILNFKKDYPRYRLFKLEQNYRSTKTIVNAANSLIAKNKGQIPKKIWSDNETGDKLLLVECPTDHEEGAVVADSIVEKLSSGKSEFSDFAVLYRTNAQSRIFEEALRKRSVPYKVYGSLSFYQRKEIKDLLAWFRISVNKRDQQALFRIINYPARGIGKTTTDKIIRYSTETGINPLDIISGIDRYRHALSLNRGTEARLAGFADLLRGFSEKAANEDAWQAAIHIASASGVLKDLFDPRSTGNIAKYENIQELLNAVKEFTSQQEEPGESTSLTAFLQNVSLLTDADTEKPDDRNKVTLMTIHSAKGLEFRHVYVGGLEEELFPNRFSSGSLSELEEERRLFYVALTRAEVSATISWARTRYRWGTPSMCRPSRFISEIDPQFLEFAPEKAFGMKDLPFGERDTAEKYSGVQRFGYRKDQKERESRKLSVHDSTGTSAGLLHGRRLIRMDGPGKTASTGAGKTTPPEAGKTALQETGKTAGPGTGEAATSGTGNASGSGTGGHQGLRTGMRVEHDRFGQGKIISIEGQPPNTRATVLFTSAGQKQLLLKFAKLRILPS